MLSCSFCYRSECLRKYIFFVAISENLVKIFVIFTSWTFEKKKKTLRITTDILLLQNGQYLCYLTLVPLSISFTYIFFQELELNNLVFTCFFLVFFFSSELISQHLYLEVNATSQFIVFWHLFLFRVPLIHITQVIIQSDSSDYSLKLPEMQ